MEKLESLVTAARAGDLDAYGRIVRRFQDMGYGYAYSILGDFHLAEDAAQEAFIEAYQCLGNLREAAAFPGWFRRIVFKHCDRLRRRKQVPAVPLDAAAGVASRERPPAQAAEDREMRDKVLAAIRQLPEQERTVTTLFYINGYSQSDIAEFLEVPAGTIKSRLAASRNRLKERMIKMVSDELKSHPLPEEFPEQIQELLAFPKPLEIDGHPIQQVWEAFRSFFADYELVKLDEVLDRSLSHLRPEQVQKAAYEIDNERMLRTDLTAGLTNQWLERGGGPSQLIAVGRTFRKGGTKTPWKSANVFHMAEALWVEEGLGEQEARETAMRAAKAVIGEVEIRVGPPEDIGGGIQGRELEVACSDGSLEFAVYGLHPAELLTKGGLAPDRFGGICICFGLDRCAQIRFGIDDIRKLWSPPYVAE